MTKQNAKDEFYKLISSVFTKEQVNEVREQIAQQTAKRPLNR